MNEEELSHVRRGALLHDIGKMGIPDSILLKPGKLTEEEWDVMRKHPVHSFRMLSRIEYLRQAIDIPYWPPRKVGWNWLSERIKRRGDSFWRPVYCHCRRMGLLLHQTGPTGKAWPKKKRLSISKEQAANILTPKLVDLFLQEQSKCTE